MKGLPIELFLILAFAAAMVLNVVMQRVTRRKQSELAAHEALQQEDGADDLEPRRQAAPAIDWQGPAAEGAPRRRAATPVPRPANRRFDVRAMLGSRRAVQDAFVVATVLGRCRADEPHEVR